ncbi:MAG: DUF502 domain-containing protein [Candidatus Aminicenantia bacterium]
MKFHRKLESIFLTGLFSSLPLIVTVVLLKILFELVDGFLSPIFRLIFKRNIPGAGLVATLILTFLIGLMVKNLIGRLILGKIDEFLSKIPFIKTIYSSAKQLILSFSPDNKLGLKRVVAVKFFGENYSIAFITNEATIKFGEEEKRAYSIFLPTTPSPITGFYLLVPQEDVIPLDLSVEDAIKMLISGGAVLPKDSLEKKSSFERFE